ncbi:MAG TPA: hypothetical protein VJ551_00210 [Nitrososphaeraceae archaeon]|nr:hypothetical protein [Nitrososphaeraceae archaeon]
MSKISYKGLELFAPNSRPFGRTYAEWTAKWWQWALSIPKTENPLVDENGESCAINQNGPVWFLAGTLKGPAERSCTIPVDRAILFPVINFEASVAEGDGTKDEELVARAKFEMDQITNIRAMICGTSVNELKQYRIQSPPFNVTLPADNVLGLPAQTTKMISEGYWLFLKPLEPGNYDLYSFGSCLAGRIRIGISYHLSIEK